MVKKFIFAAVIIISFLSVYPLVHSGLPPTHDGEYHVVRFYEFYKTFIDGSIYPRWAPDLNNGFGIPLFNYVYPFPNYVASFLHMIGFSFIDSFKLNMLLASIIGTIFTFLWSKQFWGNWGGIVSSSFYAFAPYHLLDIYIRGSVGEVWALAFFPGFLWALTKFIKENKKEFLFLSSILLSLVIFSHNILALMFIIFGAVYTIAISKNLHQLKNSFPILLISVGISAIFWMPALFEKSFVKGLEVYDYSSSFPEFYQLIIPSWGSGFAGGKLQNQLSYQIGLANLLVIILSLILLLKKSFNQKKTIIFFAISFIVIFLLMLSISDPIWKIVPLMNYFQFPWRFLSLEIIICSFLAGSVIFFWKKEIVSIALIILSISLGLGYTGFAYYHDRDDDYYLTRSNFIDGTNSPGNSFNTIWAKNLQKQKEKIVFIKGKILSQEINSTKYTFNVDSEKGGEFIINTAYFPGWSVYVDRKKTQTKVLDNGNFSIVLPSGRHDIKIEFEDTLIRIIATLLSLSSLIFVLLSMRRFVKIKR